ncbi:MAG: alpha/beta hydrolase [Caldilineales bacterium]|nr:alpha/beta hydrolase [Caldilineales bacterium]
MKIVTKSLTFLAALLIASVFMVTKRPPFNVLLWPLKLIGAALSPVLATVGAVGGFLGLRQRNPLQSLAGLMAFLLSSYYIRSVTQPHNGFMQAFGAGWQARVPAPMRDGWASRRWSPIATPPKTSQLERDLVYTQPGDIGHPLRFDMWQPGQGVRRSGLAVIYVHGGAWRIGEKDLGTRHFFRRLTAQGHVVMDIEYTLCPQALIPQMATEVKQAILWLKQHADDYKVDPDRIVLMGGSAGGHLALLAAYTPDDARFQPATVSQSTAVHGVVAFYPPADLRRANADAENTYRHIDDANGLRAAVTEALLNVLDLAGTIDPERGRISIIAESVGCTFEQNPQPYNELSPISYVGPHCPPTLLLASHDDIFQLTPTIHTLHESLTQAGAISILIDYPHTEHAFDLLFPQISPVAQAAAYEVERFLAVMATD